MEFSSFAIMPKTSNGCWNSSNRWTSKRARVLSASKPARGQSRHHRRRRVSRSRGNPFAVTAERAALAQLGGGCQVPIGIYCRREFAGEGTINESFEIFGVVASPSSGKAVRVHFHAAKQNSNPVSLGQTAAAMLLENGAQLLLALAADDVPPPPPEPPTVQKAQGQESCQADNEGQQMNPPLVGRRVLVTRAAHQASKLSEGLRAAGFEPIEPPVLEIAPPEDFASLDSALRKLGDYDWLILTSANTIQALADRTATLGISLTASTQLQVAAVGEATAAAARAAGFRVDLVPETYVAEFLAKHIAPITAGKKILLARAAIARDVIPDALWGARRRGRCRLRLP